MTIVHKKCKKEAEKEQQNLWMNDVSYRLAFCLLSIKQLEIVLY